MNTKKNFFLSLLACSINVDAFAPASRFALKTTSNIYTNKISASTILKSSSSPTNDAFELLINIPPSDSGLQAQMKIEPVLSVPSEIVEVRYKIPFGLNVEPKENLAMCTKDGAGGEKEGDILRYTSMWSLGLPQGDGLVSTAASFAGGVGWRCSLFDVMKARQWNEVVEALTSNVESRTDEVVLLFERPLTSQ